MSKKHRSRRKMKPYQVKLRIIGIMSIIVSLLVLWLPLPSKAADTEPQTQWQKEFGVSDDGSSYWSGLDSDAVENRFVDFQHYTGDPSNVPVTIDENANVVISAGTIQIPSEARKGTQKAYQSRLGAQGTGIFSGVTTLKDASLQKVRITSASTSLKDLFSGCTVLETVTFPTTVDSSALKDISGMFRNCSSLTELDLRMFDFSAVTDADDVFTGCSELDTITIKVPDSSLAAAITMPDGNTFRYESVGAPYETTTVPKDGENGLTAGTILTLTRAKDIEELKVYQGTDVIANDNGTGTGMQKTSGKRQLKLGGSETYKAELLPAGAETLSIKAEVTKGSGNVTVAPSPITIQPDGTATLTITGAGLTGTENAEVTVTASSTSGLKEVTRSVTIVIEVLKEVIDVTGISVDSTREINTTTATDAEKTFSATVYPSNATNKNVTWSVSPADGSVASIDANTGVLTPKKAGTVIVTAASADKPDITDSCTVTITSSYDLTLNDQRTDVTNRKNSEMVQVESRPIAGNRKLLVRESGGTDIGPQLSNIAHSEEIFFTLTVTDESDTPVTTPEDYDHVTVALALPGKMFNKPGLTPVVYAYNGGGTEANPITSKRVMLKENTEGVEFTVDIGTPVKEYAIVMKDSSPLLSITQKDARTNPTVKAKVTKTDRTTMITNLYLQIRELSDSEPSDMKTYVNNHDTYKSYQTKHFYEIYLSSDEAGAKRVNDFTEVDVELSLPSDVSAVSPYFTILTDKADGNPAVTLGYSLTNDGSTDYAKFQPTHFSEVAVLDNSQAAAVYTISTYHSGAGSSATVTTISGNDATTITTVTGADATATVPRTTNETVTVTATTPANSGYVFSHWTEGTSSTTPVTNSDGTPAGAVYTFTPTGNRILNAVFVEDTTPTPTPTDTYTVAIDRLPSAGGTASADKNAYQAGETATVTASPAEGYVFRFWADETGAPISQELTTTVTVNGNRRLYAVFDRASDVAGAGRTADAVVNVNVPAINVPAPQVNVPAPQVSVNVPAVNVNIPAINVHAGTGTSNAHAGTSRTFHPLAFHRPGNYADMPRTGTVSMYRVMLTIILLMSGTVEVLLSIPAKKKRRMRTG